MLSSLKIGYLLFENVSLIAGLLTFLTTIEAGAYMSSKFISHDSFLNSSSLAIALIDPHLIDEIESNPSFQRIGVLIRKKILAMHDFQIEIPLS